MTFLCFRIFFQFFFLYELSRWDDIWRVFRKFSSNAHSLWPWNVAPSVNPDRWRLKFCFFNLCREFLKICRNFHAVPSFSFFLDAGTQRLSASGSNILRVFFVSKMCDCCHFYSRPSVSSNGIICFDKILLSMASILDAIQWTLYSFAYCFIFGCARCTWSRQYTTNQYIGCPV